MGYFDRLRSLSRGRSTGVEPAPRPADWAPGSAPEPLEREVTRLAPPAAPPPPAQHRVAERDAPEPVPRGLPAAGADGPTLDVRTAEAAARPPEAELPPRRAGRSDPRPEGAPGPPAASSAEPTEPVERERLGEARPATPQRGSARSRKGRREGRARRPRPGAALPVRRVPRSRRRAGGWRSGRRNASTRLSSACAAGWRSPGRKRARQSLPRRLR